MITVSNQTVSISTQTLDAAITNGYLTSLRDKHGVSFLGEVDNSAGSMLSLVYRGGERIQVNESKISSITCTSINDHMAQIVCEGWYGEGVLLIEEDEATGDLLLTPSVSTKRDGLLACSMQIKGVRDDLKVVAPLYQGVCLDLGDPLINNQHFRWPIEWEAGLCIFQGQGNGFWVRCQDTKYTYKAIRFAGNGIYLNTEAHGPIDDNRAAGGLTWRVNVYNGGWEVPAKKYNSWLFDAYNFHGAMSRRPAWINDLKLAVSWCPTSIDLLDALAAKSEPEKILLHLPNWRNFGYDENYPDYMPSPKGQAFIDHAKNLGFHVLPHANSIDMDPTSDVYKRIAGFEYRDVENRKYLGWGYDKDVGVMDVPQAGGNFMDNRHRKVMIKVHPGLAMWRAILTSKIKESLEVTKVDGIFLDVTLCSFNVHNSLVENTSTSEGMKLLLAQIASINGNTAIGGEGLNEITVGDLSFAQMHLFRSHQVSCAGLERTGACNLNTYLYGGLCKLFGYSALGGKTEDSQMRMRITEEHDAIPTITVGGAHDILDACEAVKARL